MAPVAASIRMADSALTTGPWGQPLISLDSMGKEEASVVSLSAYVASSVVCVAWDVKVLKEKQTIPANRTAMALCANFMYIS